MSSRKLIIANWKMNPSSSRDACALAEKTDAAAGEHENVQVVIAPPVPFLLLIAPHLAYATLGAQNVSWERQGAFTGEVSAAMLKNSKVEYVIVGHSERRALGETDAMVNKKVLAALKAGLKAILCVGEPWEVRKKGLPAAKQFVRRQLVSDLRGIHSSHLKPITYNLCIAYEPVWAISGGDPNHKADNPENAIEMILHIKKILFSIFHFLDSRVLYGGSVNAKNAEGFLREPEIGGALVGGASLKSDEFAKILKAAAKYGKV
jgi:triosephosphate isomerase